MDTTFKFEKKKTPDWLQRLGRQDHPDDLKHITMDMMHCDIEDILTDSCFYYCSGSDATPIIALEGSVHSFIYSDNCLYQNYDDGLFRLKERLRKKEVEEIQKTNIDLGFLNLHKHNLEKIRLPNNQGIVKPFPTGEFSIWEKDNIIFSLLYLCWDDICVWRNLYERNQIYPQAICVYRPESSNMWNEDNFKVWDENNLPKYFIGAGANPLGGNYFHKIGEAEYYGDYDDGPLGIYEKKQSSA